MRPRPRTRPSSSSSRIKVYKTSEGAAGANALYVILFDPRPRTRSTSCSQLLSEGHDRREQRAPETQEMFKKATGAFAAGYNKLSLTPVK